MKIFLFFVGIIMCCLPIKKVCGQSQTVTNGQATAPVTFTGSACDYNWSSDNTNIGMREMGTGTIPSFIAVNPGTTPVVAHISASAGSAAHEYIFTVSQLLQNVEAFDFEDRTKDSTHRFVLKLGSDPYGISASLDNTRMYITNRISGTVTVINPIQKNIIATVPVGARPEGVVASLDGKKVYVANYDDGTVSVIDPSTFTVSNTITNVSLHPSGIAISPDGTKLYVTDASSSTVRVINTITNTPGASITVAAGPTGITVSPDGSKIYVANAGANKVTVINAADNTIATTINVDTQPFEVALSFDGKTLYVTNTGSNTLSVINTGTNTVTTTVNVGNSPKGVSANQKGTFVYVANYGSDNVSVISTADYSISDTRITAPGPIMFGNFITGGRDCSTTPITFTITVNPTPPSITATGTLAALTTSQGLPSVSTSFNLSALSLSNGLLITPPPGFEVSTDDITYSSTLTIGTGGNIPDTKIYVRLAASAIQGTYSGNIVLSSPGATAVNVATATSTVTAPVAGIIVSKATGTIDACAGTPSVNPAVQQFTVSAINLNGVFSAQSLTTDFEVSLNASSGYSNTVTIGNVTGNVPNTTIYVRSSATASGAISGNIMLISPGATSKTIAVKGNVHTLPTADPVTDKVYNAGTATPVIKLTGTGNNSFNWVNDKPGIGLPATGTGDIASFMPVNNGPVPITATIYATPISTPLAYVINFNENSVSAINTATNTVASTITTGSLPYAMAVSPDYTKAYVANYSSNDVTVINIGTGAVITTIKVGTEPTMIWVNDDGSIVSALNFNDNTVSQISTATNKVIATVDVHSVNIPGTTTPDGKYAFGIFDFTVSLVSTATGRTVATFNTESSTGGAIASPDSKIVYITDQFSNSVWVINMADFSVITKIKVGASPHGLSLNADGSRLYVTNSRANTVSVINTASNAVIATVPVGNFPIIIANSTGTGCSGIPAKFTITINPTPPTITATGLPEALTTTVGTPSPSTSFTVSGIKMTEGILVTPPPGFEVSLDDVTYTSTVLVPGTGTIDPASVFIRLAATTPIGSYSGNIVLTSAGATAVNVSMPTSTVTAPVPTIVITATTGVIFACAGTPSASPNLQQFKVSGTLLTNNITATAPAGFEVALTPTGIFGNTVTLTQSGGSLSATPVYVRSSASASGNIIGDVILSTPGGLSRIATVKGTVNLLPTVNPVPDQGPIPSGQVTADVNFTGTANTYIWTNDTPGIGLPASGAGNIASFTAVNNTSNTLTATITATPLSASFAYVATSNGISLFNTGSNKIIKTIPVGSVPYGVAVSPDGKFIYTTNQNSNTVSVINTTTNSVTATITTGTNPAGIAISPDGMWLYVANRNSNTLTVIDAVGGRVFTTVNVDLSPDGVAISPDGSMVYVANRGSNTVSAINTTSLVVTRISVGKSPQGVAVSRDGALLYVTNYNDNNVWVISTETNGVIVKIPVRTNPNGINISPDGTKIYVSNSGSNSVSVINALTNTVMVTIAVGTTPEGISFSPDGSMAYVVNYGSNNMTPIRATDNFVYAPVPVGSAPISFGNFITGGSGCSGTPIKFKIIVSSLSAYITATGTLAALVTNYGTPSISTKFDVSGVGLKTGVLVTPPAGFEVSGDNKTFGPTVTIGTAGNFGPLPVYIRLAAKTPVGIYSGDITLSGNGASNATIATAPSTVNTILLTVIADNKTKIKGNVNPVLTASYAGFVNGDTPAQLTTPPVLTTTATTTSDIGQYPITVNGAASPNYTFSYVDGILTVSLTGQLLTIPNTFTPNGDGINDTWEIKDLAGYPNSMVDVFDRYGVKVYSATGYGAAWDGTYKGAKVPNGTYYYIIDLKNSTKAMAGNITVIR